MKNAFQPENIIFFPDHLEVCFQRGTLPNQENSDILALNYDEKISEILNEWAIPEATNRG